MSEQQSEEWKLEHGIHRRTLTSRDHAGPAYFASRDAALVKLAEHRTFYQQLGYVLWYAYLTSPAGERETLASDSGYY